MVREQYEIEVWGTVLYIAAISTTLDKSAIDSAIEDVKKFDVQIVDAQKAYDNFIATNPKPTADDVVAAQIYTQQLSGRQTTLTGLQQQCQ